MSKPASPQSPPQTTDWLRVFLLVGAGVAAAFQVGKAPPVLPILRAELSMSLFAAGWMWSAYFVLGLALGPTGGAVADWLGHRRVLLAGLFLQAVAGAAGAAANGPAWLLASRFAEGLGFIFVVVSAPALIVRITRPQDMRMAISVWGCFLPAGAAIMMVFAPAVVPVLGWRGFWLFNAALLGLLIIGLWLSTKDMAQSAGAGRLKTLGRDLKDTVFSPGPLLLALVFSTYTLQFGGVMGFLPTYLVEREGLATGLASVMAALVMGMNMAGNLAAGRLLTGGAPRGRLIIIASLAMAGAGFLIFGPGMPLGLRYGAALVFSGAGGLLPAACLVGAVAHAPKPRLVATSQGLLMQGSQLGNVAGPPILALVVAAGGGWQAAPFLLMPVAGLGVVLGVVLARLEKRKGLG